MIEQIVGDDIANCIFLYIDYNINILHINLCDRLHDQGNNPLIP